MGPLKIVTSKYRLITYISLKRYKDKYEKINGVMSKECKVKFINYNKCTQFNYRLTSLFYEVPHEQDQIRLG